MWCLFQCVCESVSHVFVSYSSSSGLDHESVILYIILVMMHRLMYCLVVDGSLLKKVLWISLILYVYLVFQRKRFGPHWRTTCLLKHQSPVQSRRGRQCCRLPTMWLMNRYTGNTHTHTGELRVHFFFVCIALVLIVEDTATIWVKV